MLKAARVPPPFVAPFEAAERHVEKLFARIERKPEQGTLRVGGDRYVLVSCDSLYLAWFDSMAKTFGDEAASEFIYNTAREIGRNDCRRFNEKLEVERGVESLAAGPVHFAHAGWALVDILADSRPATDGTYFLHYVHPNTFESEVLATRKLRRSGCSCFFSAGYSSGWCSEAFGVEVYGREVRCTSRGDGVCEFIMAPADRLDELQAKVVRG